MSISYWQYRTNVTTVCNLLNGTSLELLRCADQGVRVRADELSYIPGDSRSDAASQRAISASAIYPTSDGSIDTLLLNGNLITERLSDPRQDSYDRVIGVINEVQEMTEVAEQGRSGTLPEGVSGFFGLGVYQVCLPSVTLPVTT